MCCGCLLSVSCSHKSEVYDSIKTYNLDNLAEGEIQDIFSDVELIELQFDGDDYPRSISNLHLDSDRVFISARQKFYVYSSDGKLISSSLSKKGNGPGEFAVSIGFSWNPYSKQIEVLTPQKVMFYDENFNFIRESKLETKFKNAENPEPLFFDEILDLSPQLHVLRPTSISESPYRFLIYDSVSEEILGEVSYADDVITGFNQQAVSFFRLPNDVIMTHPRCVDPYTYEFNPTDYSLSKRIMVDTGNNGLTEEDINTHSHDEFNYVRACDKYIPLKTLVSSGRLIVEFKQSNMNSDNFIVLFSDNHPDGLKFNWCNSDIQQIFPNLYYIDEDYAYGLNINHYIKDSPSIVLGQSEKMNQLQSMDDESWVLLKYKFKD